MPTCHTPQASALLCSLIEHRDLDPVTQLATIAYALLDLLERYPGALEPLHRQQIRMAIRLIEGELIADEDQDEEERENEIEARVEEELKRRDLAQAFEKLRAAGRISSDAGIESPARG